MILTSGGLELVSGIIVFSVSILSIIGTAGLATVIAAFGIATSTIGMSEGTLNFIKNLSKSPYCLNDDEKEVVFNF
jgi:hypothetical protein